MVPEIPALQEAWEVAKKVHYAAMVDIFGADSAALHQTLTSPFASPVSSPVLLSPQPAAMLQPAVADLLQPAAAAMLQPAVADLLQPAAAAMLQPAAAALTKPVPAMIQPAPAFRAPSLPP